MESGVWDDSALINAFNTAMAKYQDMHKKAINGIAEEESEAAIKAISNGSLDEGNEETTIATARCLNADQAHYGESGQVQSLQDCSAGYLHTSKNLDAARSSVQMDNSDQHHTRLVNSYYELEKQRQEMLQQFYYSNGSNYQGTNEQDSSNVQWSGCGFCQWGHDTSYNPSCPPTQLYCHAYPHYWPAQPVPCMGPCSQFATCSLGAGFTKNNKSNSYCQCGNVTHSTAVKSTVEPSRMSFSAERLADTIVDAVKKATSTVKTESPKSGDLREGELKIEKSGEENFSPDITEMLHAWFSAGFATARFLYGKTNGEENH